MFQCNHSNGWQIQLRNKLCKQTIKFIKKESNLKSNQINQVNVKWNNKDLFVIKENMH